MSVSTAAVRRASTSIGCDRPTAAAWRAHRPRRPTRPAPAPAACRPDRDGGQLARDGPPRSRVSAGEREGGDADGDRRVPAEEGEARPRVQRVGDLMGHVHSLPRRRRQVRHDAALPRARQGGGNRGYDDQQREQRSDGTRRVADEEAQRECQHAQHRQIERHAEHGAERAWSAEGDTMGAEQRLPPEERTEGRGERECECHRREHGHLAPEHRQPLRHRTKGRPDHARGVLPGDDEDAEHPYGELGQVDPDQAAPDEVVRQLLTRVEVCPTGVGDRRYEQTETDHEQRGQCRDDDGRPHRAELDPFRSDDIALGDAANLDGPRGGGRGDRAHAALRSGWSVWPWNSTASVVSSMNASSRDALSVKSSCTAMPWAHATSPTCSAEVPRTTSTPPPSSLTVTSGATSRSRSRPVSRERTRTAPADAFCTSSSMLTSAISRPRPMTITWSAVCAISLMRWLDTNTVRPSAARLLSRLRTQRIPSGSSPFTGASRMRVLGSPRRAAAIPRRCPIPSEKAPTRFRATAPSPTRSITSSTLRRGMAWVAARASRWFSAVRPV